MTDLINRTDLLANLNQRIADARTPIVKGVLIAVKSAIEQMPRADAEPVVRCKDCVLHNKCFTEYALVRMDLGKAYCCCGKRKDGARMDEEVKE